jgi:hypothetical protein
MTVENYLAEAGMFVGLAGVLAGFSLAAVIQLLTANVSGKLATAAIVIFAASSLMFLYGLLVAMSAFAAAAELNRVPTELNNISVTAFLSMVGAIYVFIGGIALLGWLRSRTAGLLTTLFAVLSACFITYTISSLISLFI